MKKKALDKLKMFPKFSDSLVFVSLEAEIRQVRIGKHFSVTYEYARRVPKLEVKKYTPLSTWIQRGIQAFIMINNIKFRPQKIFLNISK